MKQGPPKPDKVQIPDATTVSEIVAEYERQGYVMSFSVADGGGVRCGACRTVSDASSVAVNAIARAEGPSDPADMAMVGVVTCPWCSMAGVLVVGFGPQASPEDSDVVSRLNDVRPENGLHLLPPG